MIESQKNITSEKYFFNTILTFKQLVFEYNLKINLYNIILEKLFA